jgi:hypothetical protein
MPSENVSDDCGSRSTNRTRSPSAAHAEPSACTDVVFATPPFWFATAITRGIAGVY